MTIEAAEGSAGALAMAAPPPDRKRWSPRGPLDALQPTAAPPPPPRRPHGGGFLGKLSAFLTALLVFAVIGGGAVLYGRSVLTAPGPLQQDKVVFIPRGTGASEIATLLEQQGVISSALAFEAAHLLSGAASLRAGEYQFKQHASLKDVRDILIAGRSIQHAITIPEGLTSEQIVQRIRENDVLEGEVKTIPREGSLLPDTYRFERGTSREQMLARMEREQRRLLQEIWARRSPDLPLKTPAELVTLASIVEKETGRADERTRVAAVFINRLNRGMRLESDPTIIYGIVGGKGSLGRPILASEIRAPTAYNTYVISGLPPGPIANPGRAALEATANPSRTRDLFFVADGTGGHAFAETYEQHQRNVARWRQIEQGNAPAAQPGGAAPPASAPAPPAAQRPRQQRSDALSNEGVRPSPFALPQADFSFLGPMTQPDSGVAAGFGDERELPPQSGAIESYPVAPGRRQEMQRAAAQAGVARPEESRPPVAAFAEEPPAPVPGPLQRRPRAFDASEGTARDPLRNRTFDLTSPKTVPTLR